MDKETQILEFIKKHPNCSSMEIVKGLNEEYSLATIKRALVALLDKGFIAQEGRCKVLQSYLSKRQIFNER